MEMKYTNGILWNYLSIVVMAISGLLMNAIIAKSYNTTVLGVFNETYAWYMILSQVTVWGIHMAVLKFVPEQSSIYVKGSILKSAIVGTILASVIIVTLSEAVLYAIRTIPWEKSLSIALIGLPLFSINKVLLNYLNALYELVAFAILQSLRYLTLVVSTVVLSVMHVNGNSLATIFPIAEGLTCIIIFGFILTKKEADGHFDKRIAKEIIAFGTRIMPSNMVVEMNTKVDVVCLGFLVQNTAKIGVYSFAILFTEGFYMLFMTVRKIVNPGISESNAKKQLGHYLESFNQIFRKYLVPLSLLSYALILVAYYLAYKIIGGSEYRIGMLYIAIICVAIVINARSIIWGDLLSQTGFPLDESKANMLTVMSNTFLNIGLISVFGTVGAAVATSISYFIYGILMHRAIMLKTGFKI